MKTFQTEVVLCIGSNCGDLRENVEKALSRLSGMLKEFRHSTIYATPDIHGGQREYMNAVVIGRTDLSFEELEALCKEFELSLGRNSEARKRGDVPVDMDVVVYDGKVLRERDYKAEFFRIGYLSIEYEVSSMKKGTIP